MPINPANAVALNLPSLESRVTIFSLLFTKKAGQSVRLFHKVTAYYLTTNLLMAVPPAVETLTK